MSFGLRRGKVAGDLDDNAYSVFGIGVPARSGVWRAWVKHRKTRFIQPSYVSCTYLKEKEREYHDRTAPCNFTRPKTPMLLYQTVTPSLLT